MSLLISSTIVPSLTKLSQTLLFFLLFKHLLIPFWGLCTRCSFSPNLPRPNSHCFCLSKNVISSESFPLTPLWNESPTAPIILYHMSLFYFLHRPYHYLKLYYLLDYLFISFLQDNMHSTRGGNLTALFTDLFCLQN